MNFSRTAQPQQTHVQDTETRSLPMTGTVIRTKQQNNFKLYVILQQGIDGRR